MIPCVTYVSFPLVLQVLDTVDEILPYGDPLGIAKDIDLRASQALFASGEQCIPQYYIL